MPEGSGPAPFSEAAAVGVDLTIVIELLVENQSESGRLDDLERLGNGKGLRNAVRQTSFAGHALAIAVPTSFVYGFARWLEKHLDARADPVLPTRARLGATWPPPDPGQIRLSVRGSLYRRRQIRFAVRRTRRSGLRHIDPLRHGWRTQHAHNRQADRERSRVHH